MRIGWRNKFECCDAIASIQRDLAVPFSEFIAWTIKKIYKQ